MKHTEALLIACLFVPLVLSAGCEQEKEGAVGIPPPPAEEIQSEKPHESAENIALNTTYTVIPEPNGYATTFETDATDGRKPTSMESCFGYSRQNTSESITLDMDIGREEKINGATLYTFFNKYDKENNECGYGANYVEVFGSGNGDFIGEEKLLGKAGEPEIALGAGGECFFEIQFDPYTCRYVRFVVKKQFGDGATGTDWLFIKEAEVWKAAD